MLGSNLHIGLPENNCLWGTSMLLLVRKIKVQLHAVYYIYVYRSARSDHDGAVSAHLHACRNEYHPRVARTAACNACTRIMIMCRLGVDQVKSLAWHAYKP